MKIFFLILALVAGTAVGAEPVTEEITALEQALSEDFGGKVKVDISTDQCRVLYPETQAQDLTDFFLSVQRAAADGQRPDIEHMEPQSVTIAQSEATCQKVDDFKTQAQYHILASSPDKLKAQMANMFAGVSLVKGLKINSIREEWDVVPEMKWTRAQNVKAQGISYVQPDPETGNEETMITLHDFFNQEEWTEESNKITYQMDTSFHGLDFNVGLFSAQVPSSQEHLKISYILPENAQFDYHQMLNNLPYIDAAKSKTLFKGIKVGIPVLEFSTSFDIGTNNSINRTEQGAISLTGALFLKNINIPMISTDTEKLPKNVEIKYALKDVPADILDELSQMIKENKENESRAQQLLLSILKRDTSAVNILNQLREKIGTEDESKLRLARLLDRIAEKAKLIINVDTYFANADILLTLSLTRKNGYLNGIGSIKVDHLFNLFPQQANCAKKTSYSRFMHNEKTCPSDDMFSSLGMVIDTTQDTSKTIYTFTEQGIFKDDVQIAPPVELNFEKMYLERKAREKEALEQMESWRKQMEEMGELEEMDPDFMDDPRMRELEAKLAEDVQNQTFEP